MVIGAAQNSWRNLGIFSVKQRFEDTAEKKVNLVISGRRAPGIELKSWGVEL
jgi:hypothetical protein